MLCSVTRTPSSERVKLEFHLAVVQKNAQKSVKQVQSYCFPAVLVAVADVIAKALNSCDPEILLS